MATILVTGATGLVGGQLLQRQPQARVLTRDIDRARRRLGPGVQAFAWRPEAEPAPAAAFEGVRVVFHLAGEPVAGGRWSAARKQQIRDSRVIGTRHLVAALAQLDTRPSVLVCASAVGFYGDRGDAQLDEGSPPGSGFLATVCHEWEAEALEARRLGIRVVVARLGLVLSRRGGLLQSMRTPFRCGVGGRLGSGRQWMPWVHIDDVVGLLGFAAETTAIHGPLNVVGPNPVTNAEFTRVLGRALHRPTLLPLVKPMLRVAFGELADAMLASQRVVPELARRSGYEFRYSHLDDALSDCAAGYPLGDPRA